MMRSTLPTELRGLSAPSPALSPRRLWTWEAGLVVAVLAIGLLNTYAGRYAMNPDGISYVDLAAAYAHHDWHNAINAQWSPLYPLLLGLGFALFAPAPVSEAVYLHAASFGLYVFALVSFVYFLHQLMRWSQSPADSSTAGFSEFCTMLLGYSLAAYALNTFISPALITPDLAVAAIAFLASALLIRIRLGRAGWGSYAVLGAVLGVGYLFKSPLFPLGFVFLFAAAFCAESTGAGARRALVGLGIMLAIAGPYICAISLQKHRPTFGDSGRLAYIWFVDGASFVHLSRSGTAAGTPAHPTRKILDSPPVYEFATPIAGSYPPWYDPSYWYEGVQPQLDLAGQWRVVKASLEAYASIFLGRRAFLLLCLAALFVLQGRSGVPFAALRERWPVLLPALAALAMFALVYVEPRYVGGFVLIVWVTLLSAVRLPATTLARSLLRVITAVVVIAATVVLLSHAVAELRNPAASRNTQWEVAKAIHEEFGLAEHTRVACLGYCFNAYWARLGRFRIVAEIPSLGANEFWSASPERQERALDALASTGSRLVVAQTLPRFTSTEGWHRIGDTGYYARSLPARVEPPQ